MCRIRTYGGSFDRVLNLDVPQVSQPGVAQYGMTGMAVDVGTCVIGTVCQPRCRLLGEVGGALNLNLRAYRES